MNTAAGVQMKSKEMYLNPGFSEATAFFKTSASTKSV
jgi:hypothetical protein